MAKSIQEWLETDVAKLKKKSVRWLSEYYFSRDLVRPIYTDSDYFFTPADGIILYQKVVEPCDPIVEIKGKNYTLRDALQDSSYNQTSLIIGIFMSFYDVHVNRVSLTGRLCYKFLDSIQSYNFPMLVVEKDLINEGLVNLKNAEYLVNNERVINKIFAPSIQQFYYILQIADYDVDVITPFFLKQNVQVSQNQRFSFIRYGSQVDLIIPLSEKFTFEFVQEEGVHVETCFDKLVKITKNT